MSNDPNLKEILQPNLQKITVKKILTEYDDKFNPGRKNTMCIVNYQGQDAVHYFKDKDYIHMREGNEVLVMLETSTKGKYVKVIPSGEENSIENLPHNNPVPDDSTPKAQDNRELSIVTQSILHIHGYYKPEESFKNNLERAIIHAKYLLQRINEPEVPTIDDFKPTPAEEPKEEKYNSKLQF